MFFYVATIYYTEKKGILLLITVILFYLVNFASGISKIFSNHIFAWIKKILFRIKNYPPIWKPCLYSIEKQVCELEATKNNKDLNFLNKKC